jgi:hypothetical protein
MAKVVVFAPMPPSRSAVAPAGRALVKLLKRSRLRRRHTIRAMWPVPESVEAVLSGVNLAVYFLANDPEEREIYQLAMEHPGLVVLEDLSLDRVINVLVRARDPLGTSARREAERLAPRVEDLGLDPALPWCAQAVRQARGVVVHSEEDRRYLDALGCRTPVYVAPPPGAGDPSGYEAAVDATLRLVLDPAEWTLSRWTAALTDAGVGVDGLREGYGLRYAEALEEIRTSPAGAP